MNHSIVLEILFACIHELHAFVRPDTLMLAATATVNYQGNTIRCEGGIIYEGL